MANETADAMRAAILLDMWSRAYAKAGIGIRTARPAIRARMRMPGPSFPTGGKT